MSTPNSAASARRRSPKMIAILLLLLIAVATAAFLSIRYYPYLFARNVSGEVIEVERVSQDMAIMSGRDIPAQQLFSFAIAIRDRAAGEIFTASSEDRQWAVVRKGQCAEARFLRYPPWHLEKGGTYYGARLTRLYDCPK